MTDVSVTELRQQLQSYLARVQRGERVRVTHRGRVVAELSPPSSPADAAARARARLAGSVLRFDDPFAPVLDPSRWDAPA